MIGGFLLSGGYLLVHPLNELVPVYHHSLADKDGWEALAAHQGVCTGAGDTEDSRQFVCAEGNGQLIEGSVGYSFGHKNIGAKVSIGRHGIV